MVKPGQLDEVLLQAVDFGLLVPGEIVRAVIYERLKTTYGIESDDIPEKLPAFHQALQELLRSAAKVIERIIAKNLYSRLELDFIQLDGWTLADYVNHARETKRDG